MNTIIIFDMDASLNKRYLRMEALRWHSQANGYIQDASYRERSDVLTAIHTMTHTYTQAGRQMKRQI